jgi:solute carrier family 25 carnitine/acylcarnitine transporter 20/29
MSADFWSGYVSGAAGILIGNPLDLVKTRLQAGKTVPTPDSLAHTTVAAAPRSFKQHFESTGTLVRGELLPILLVVACSLGKVVSRRV